MRFDDRAGCIETGRPASLAVLSADLRDVAAHQVSTVDTVMTLFEGEAVYGEVD